MSHDEYQNPLITRYASREMSQLWSAQRKFETWRRLWIALAEAEAELGLEITPTQLQQLRDHVHDIDFAAAEAYERKLRHDVMAHVHAYGDVCPDARPIIHLGATSCYVTDNTDLILLRESLALVRDRLVAVIDQSEPLRRSIIATCPAWPLRICSRPSRRRWASGRRCGSRTCCWIWTNSNIAWRPCGSQREGNDGHAGQLPAVV